MSLDVYLTKKRDEPTEADRAIALLCEHGFDAFADEISARYECGDVRLYSANYTHNCGPMAEEAGIYKHLWRPDGLGITKARELIEPLRAGLVLMRSNPSRFQKHNPSNGWGSYDTFLPWVRNYLHACETFPDADVRVSR